MNFLRPVDDGFTPPRPARAALRAGAGEGFRKMALALGEQQRAHLEAEQARATVDAEPVVDELDEELEGLVTAAAAAPAAMPPVQDGLVLSRDAQHIKSCLISMLPDGESLQTMSGGRKNTSTTCVVG